MAIMSFLVPNRVSRESTTAAEVAEALAAEPAPGLIDVSMRGKLIVRGPDAGELLDRLYPNRLSHLAPGRIRYGIVDPEAGRILQDGTLCRLDESSFYVTTMSSDGATAVKEWCSRRPADSPLDIRVTDVTQGVAAFSLIGPRARDALSRLCGLDCTPERFRYLDARQAHLAGVPALILRIGLVGEVAYEIHVPAAHGRHVWDAMLEARTAPRS